MNRIGAQKNEFAMILIATNPCRAFAERLKPLIATGAALLLRFVYYYFMYPGQQTGKVQSVVVGSVFLVIAAQLFALGLLALLGLCSFRRRRRDR